MVLKISHLQVEVNGQERWVQLHFTWSGKPFTLSMADSDRVFDLKTAIHNLTKVPPERQKILGLDRIADLRLVPGKKFSLVGTPEGDEIKDPSQLEFLPDVVNDLDFDFSDNIAASAAYKNDQRNIRKVREATEKLNVNIIHSLRPGKKLLVLDIDYSATMCRNLTYCYPSNIFTAILDTKPLTSGTLPPAECARPLLHEFLEAIYPYYDICIWSQTSWIWLETKLVELGMIGSDRNYQAVLDKTCMFTVFTERDGKPWTHSVKALQIIWNKFPQYNATNTIHVDDLSRNFALNPKEGLKIQAFKNAHTPEAMADRELDKLTRYMLHIAPVADLRILAHKFRLSAQEWKQIVRGLPRH
ncbi:NLI interacting factor-like phosphatase-domain-containing protein [Lyophyllum atratum]|nr:NLI interacting factor-like phosphatase-domain-containing protein [Lyophyllum atratum]